MGEDCCGSSTLSTFMQNHLNYFSHITENKGQIQLDCFLAVTEARGKEIGLLAQLVKKKTVPKFKQ